MAATTPKPMVGGNFLATTGSSSTVYTDGDLYYLVMSDKTRMRVLVRYDDEYFSTFVDREAVRLGVEVVINGNYYDVNLTSKIWAGLGTSSASDNTTPEGYLIESQVWMGGISRPKHFFVAQLTGSTWKFGSGDPGILGTISAVGGLGPLIINGLKYGDGNLYKTGASANAPTTGDPPAADAPLLIQRNNENFKNFQQQGSTRGKTVIAYASGAGKVLVVHQPEGAPSGIDLGVLRDKLAAVGVDNAVFLDGGDSAMLWVNRVWHTSPASRKNHTNIVGVSFDIP
jgi:hypothetical protein